MKVKLKQLHPDAVTPTYGKEGDACMDLTAVEVEIADSHIEYKTGWAVEIPEGYFGLIRPRSSVSKTALQFNTSGVVDSGYRGELTVRFKVNPKYTEANVYEVGDRVAQFMILPYPHIDFVLTDELSSTERGEGGHGSTGK